MDRRYALGLDIGIASVGWAVLALDDADDPYRIINMGTRIFDAAEHPKDGASLAAPRREARSARRRLRRRHHRIERTRKLLIREGLLTKDALQHLFDAPPEKDVYTLRFEGLECCLDGEEWARVLLFFSKHRGFRSNRIVDDEAGDEGKVLSAIRQNEERLQGYRTVGEMLARDPKFADRKRNKAEDYQLTVSRTMLEKEIRTLFDAQRQWKNPHASEDFEQEYLEIFSSQRHFDEGPGGRSPYGGDQIEKMIGRCTLEPKEKRAPKASYSFQRFSLLQNINHLRIKSQNTERSLSDEERKAVEALCWKSPSVTYHKIRQEVKLPDDARFACLYYDKAPEEVEKKTKFSYTVPYHEIRKVLDKWKKDGIQELDVHQLDTIGYAFTVYKNDDRIHRYLCGHGISDAIAEVLVQNLKSFQKFGHISLKACQKLIPFLEQGMVYSDACKAADYAAPDAEPKKFLSGGMEEIREIPNPVVRRSLSQTVKIINAVIREYGSPVEVHIELAREMARSRQDRDKMKKDIENNRARNEAIKKELQELGLQNPKGQDIIKWRLYKEQDGFCAYSQKQFDVERLLHDGSYAEIDHILPYSRSFDDSYHNKVLVMAAENRQKGNRTPLEYMAGEEERIHAFRIWVNSRIHDFRKRQNLLREHFDKESTEKDWKERNLNDTKYISRFIYNLIRQHLQFAPFRTDRKQHVISVNGAVTSYIRKRLGIPKIREDGDLHHAVDAVVIASVTQGTIQKVTRYSREKETLYHCDSKGHLIDTSTGEILSPEEHQRRLAEKFPEPWSCFRKELEARTSHHPAENLRLLHLPTYTEEELVELEKPIFVSRMPNHKVRGAAHMETIRSPRLQDEGLAVSRTALTNLKLGKDENGQPVIENYYNPDSDKLLYTAILHRLQDYHGDAKKAFKEPFYKPKADGTLGPVVRKVKVTDKSNLNVSVHHGRGIAANGGMIRVDVYYIAEGKARGYYLVPVYTSDVARKILPNQAVVAYKPHAEWPGMREEDFLFSLYKNDLIHFRKKTPAKFTLTKAAQKGSTLQKAISVAEGNAYYISTGISTASINIINHDNTYGIQSLGVKSLLSLEKMQVDVLGDITPAPREPRQDFSTMKRDRFARK